MKYQNIIVVPSESVLDHLNYLQMLISILVNWGICAILTATGALTDDPNDMGFKARTDAQTGVIYDSPWFNFPYPGMFYMYYNYCISQSSISLHTETKRFCL